MFVGRLLRDFLLEIGKVFGGTTGEHSKLRRRLATALLMTVVVDAIGTTLIYVLEHGKKGSDISSVFESFFWATTQLLTVSSQIKNPVTTGGRIVDMLLELWAITIVATVAGSFAAFLQNK